MHNSPHTESQLVDSMDSEESARPEGVRDDSADRSLAIDPGSPLQNLIGAEFNEDSPGFDFARPVNSALEENNAEADGKEQNEAGKALPVRLEIELPHRPHNPSDEYEAIVSHAVECIHSQVLATGSESIYTAEFTDGRIEQITLDDLLRYENGENAMHDFMDASHVGRNSRKRKYAPDLDWESDLDYEEDERSVTDLRMNEDEEEDHDDQGEADEDEEEDEDEEASPRRPTRIRLRSRSVTVGSKPASNRSEDLESDDAPSRRLRPRRQQHLQDRETDEPRRESSEDDDFAPVISDVQTAGRLRRNQRPKRSGRRILLRRSSTGRQDDGSDIAFEAPRRSSRAVRQKYTMDHDIMDDDFYYRDDDQKGPGAPKIASIKEVFVPLQADSPFVLAHMQICHVCDGSKQRGQLVYCQGCSLSYHKACIGLRSQREHLVTKIGEADFTLQCKFCVGVYASKDKNAPKYSSCQRCRGEGPACSAFSRRLTARQEEKIREENDGVDPVTQVPPQLVNNADNVLFRCTACRRAWHRDHLQPLQDLKGIELAQSYMRARQCKQCGETKHKIHRLVAWRPTQQKMLSSDSPAPNYADISEDFKEYLVKWESKSYFHCSWQPASWVYGVSNALMRKAFHKRDLEQSLLKCNEKDAIPEEYLMADIVLCAKMSSTAPKAENKEEELANVADVHKILVKFQGLGYDDVVWDSPPSEDMGDIYRAFVNAYAEYVNGKYFQHESKFKIKERVKEYKDSEYSEIEGQPAGIRRGKLMGYQVEGLNWLLGNYHHGRSVVLADEMGLGKTVQVISLITSLVQDSPKCWPFLITVPNATCPNWRREFKQWAPDLRVVVYHGGKASQALAYKYELFPEHGKGMRAHVVIMSYDSAQDPNTATLFNSISWAGLVVDEGQRLKSDKNLLYQALLSMKIPFRLLLTGTPLQNNKRELFNLLQFIDSTQNAEKLDAEYSVLDKNTLPKLHEKIRPYFLRRTKAGVLKFLPPMAQIIIPVTMTVIQEKLSKSIMSKNPQLIKAMFANTKLNRNERGSLNNILMQLRKCLCHPFMYSDAIEEKHQDSSVVYRNLVEASAKLLLLQIMLPKLKERGHRVLIFSQFLKQLDIIEDFLNGLGFEYRRLDGQLSSLEKQRRIDAFNAPGSSLFAFLLSTRAGGVGINLATADTVIIMDPDFNPHQDIQALSRAHRIGQKKKVLCFQLMTKDTVEERIMQIGKSKMALDHALIESMDDDELEGADLESILKHGASALFNNEYQKSAIKYDAAMVDKLLDRSQAETAIVSDQGSGENQFSYARVWDTDKTDLEGLAAVEDETPQPIDSGVWDKILAQREEEARRQAEANRETFGRGHRRRTNINYTSNALAAEGDVAADRPDTDEDFATQDNSSDDDDDDVAEREIVDPSGQKARSINTVTSKASRVNASAVDELDGRQAAKAGAQPQQRPESGDVGRIPPTGTTLRTIPPHINQTNGSRRYSAASTGQSPTPSTWPARQMPVMPAPQQGLYPEQNKLLMKLTSESQVRLAIDYVHRSLANGAVKDHQLGALYGRLQQLGRAPRAVKR